MKGYIAGIFTAILVAGCADPTVLSSAAGPSLQLRVAARDGGYTAKALQGNLTSALINHIVLELKTDEGVKATLDVPKANLGKPIVFNALHHDTDYTVQATAYKEAGTAGADKISVDASSQLTFSVGKDDRPIFAAIPVQLMDVAFNGQATGSLAISDGNLTDTGPETLN